MTDIESPGLSSSPSTTASSSLEHETPNIYPLPILSLDDPKIKQIWADPRFDEPATYYPGSLLFKLGAVEEYYPPAVYHDLVPVDNTPLNPYAQPFIPRFSISSGDDPMMMIEPTHQLSANPNLLTIEEQSLPRPLCPLPCTCLPPPPTRDLPLYPPGLPHPPHHHQQQPRSSSPPHPDYPPSYTPLLIDAFKACCTPEFRTALLHAVLDRVPQWDLFALRELVKNTVCAVFGTEQDLLLRPSTRDRENSDEIFSQEIFCEVISTLSDLFLERFGEGFKRAFLLEISEVLLARFIFCFNPSNPNSLNTYTKTNDGVLPSHRYIHSALSLAKTIAYLHHHHHHPIHSLIQPANVQGCIVLLLFDLFASVQHIEALEVILVGWGSGAGNGAVGDVEPGNVQPPAVEEDGVSVFCKKLEEYRERCGRIEGGNGLVVPSLLEDGEGWCAERVGEKLKELLHVLRQ